MNGIKESCPGCSEHPGQQMAMEGFETTISDCHDNTISRQISRLLSPGRENAVPLRQIEAMTGFDSRTVRLMIQRERYSGIPILSDNATGYYLPATPKERDRFVLSMRHRAREIERVAQAVEQAGEW